MSLGPGDLHHLTPAARWALESSDLLVGYRTYLELIRPLIRGQRVVATGMRLELQRVELALERALARETVSLISGGDAGIYGMAGLVLELCRARGFTPGTGQSDFQLKLIPGIPALAAAGALLGAPLMHDFAVVSLSDLLTPWEVIEKRLRLAAEADFVIVLYNPQSKKRNWQLARAQEIILESRGGTTPVGIVGRAMRAGQSVAVTDLRSLPSHPVDMQTVVFVGNSRTFSYKSFLVTPRGYLDKYD